MEKLSPNEMVASLLMRQQINQAIILDNAAQLLTSVNRLVSLLLAAVDPPQEPVPSKPSEPATPPPPPRPNDEPDTEEFPAPAQRMRSFLDMVSAAAAKSKSERRTQNGNDSSSSRR